MMKGIDVSKWQGDIDFNKVKAYGVEFVIIRAGYGTNVKDEWFERNYEKAKAAGLHVGAYWYSYATTKADAEKEAAKCIEVLKGKQFDLPIYYDIEEPAGFPNANTNIKAFCSILEAAGFFVGVYASRSVIESQFNADTRNNYVMWVAEWGSKCTYAGSYGMWQYSETGTISGVNGNCDLDILYRDDYIDIIKSRGFNGYSKTSEEKIETAKHLFQVFIDGEEVVKYEC